MKSPYEHVSLTPAERESRKKVKRDAKNLKKIQREKQRIDNKRRLDHRPEVRMSALLELSAVAAETAPNDHDNNNNITSTPKIDSKDGSSDEDSVVAADRVVSLVDLSLSLFSLPLLSYPASSILELDISYNCLSELPGLEALTNVVSLNLRRNEFRVLPPALTTLTQLGRLNVSRNHLRPSADLFFLLTQPPLPALEALDLTFNKKLYTQAILDLLLTALPTVVIEMTITSPPPSGAYVGASAGQRDPELLRSQLEPFTTLQLRKRLVETFGYAPYNTYAGTPPAGRATVMASLLTEYKKKTGPNRRLVRSYGVPVPAAVMTGVRQELEAWSARFDNQERPMIAASKYMILRSPTEVEEKITRFGSRRAQSAQKKFQHNLSLWKVAKAAMATVDPDFAEAFTGLAVTQNFRGSPHIDTTNIGPFYGLSTGDFEERTGGVRVEVDPMTVCEVNTKDRLGRVDGRYPHWVGPYNPEKTRYSLIFYLTEGVVQPKTTAIFGEIIDDNT